MILKNQIVLFTIIVKVKTENLFETLMEGKSIKDVR